MFIRASIMVMCATALAFACCAPAGPARAQTPSAGALAAAKELVEIKGGAGMFDPVISGIVDQTRAMLLQTSPQLSKDLADVAAQLRTEFASRRAELINEASRQYAQQFTEQELKDAVAFFKTPLGRKIVAQEPGILDGTFNFIQQWAPKTAEEILARFRAEMKKKGHDL
jgi:uncharacterized protein